MFRRQREGRVALKSARELGLMRTAGQIVAEALAAMVERVVPGVTTAELDAIAARIIAGSGAAPAFTGVPANKEGVPAFPAVITASINDEIVHGIPGSRQLRPGDIVSLDVGAVYQGYYADSAVTVPVGAVNGEVQRLLEATEASLQAGVERLRAGGRLWEVIRAIQRTIDLAGFGVIREYQGHGIGRAMWEPPSVPNFLDHDGPRPKNYLLRPGMTLALEPMVSAGDWHTEVLADGWTVVTADRSLSAHFEHTVVVTEHGPEVLTRRT